MERNSTLLSILLVLVFLCSKQAQAQEPDLSQETITWNCTSTTDLNSGAVVASPSTLISSPSQVLWDQNGNITTFSISSRTWNWNNGQGAITHNVDFYGSAGTLTIEGDGSNITATIDFTGEENGSSFRLNIQDYTY